MQVTTSVVKCLKMISEKLDQVFVCHKIACFCIYSSIGLLIWINYWATVLQLLSVILMTVTLVSVRHLNILGIDDRYLCSTLVALELPQQVESGIKN